MQNPFRHRPSDDFARRDADDTRWESRDQRYEEGRSWSEGDGGRTYQAYGDQSREAGDQSRYSGSRGYGYGQDRQGAYRDEARSSYAADRGGYDQNRYGSRPEYGRNAPTGQDRSSGYASNRDPDYERHARFNDQGYTPGASIWRDNDPDRGRSAHSHHDFEPDYLHWREQQMSNFDRDYHDWRSERREKFSTDFTSWRDSRPRVKAENPIVGDVADGGTGDAREAKKS
ncbi:hypothetical protein ACIQC9_05590 [Brevundimonas sp. NPDC092305]|uniref:hypothetical protein n=1 Tax=Brevundimonas sp. NPDC092305 TaxID=3363957 RepID=UPI00382ED278